MMVIAQIQDGGNGTSPLTRRFRQHAEHMGESLVSRCRYRPLTLSQSDIILTGLRHRDGTSYAYVSSTGT